MASTSLGGLEERESRSVLHFSGNCASGKIAGGGHLEFIRE